MGLRCLFFKKRKISENCFAVKEKRPIFAPAIWISHQLKEGSRLQKAHSSIG